MSIYSMLASLIIRNFILIESADLEFQSGFTVITGETGAGKSILIDALLCALGERVQGDILKKGTEKGFVEAMFQVPASMKFPKSFFEEGYLDCELSNNERFIIIRREFTSKGLNRSFINDSPATASMARNLGELLVDFHGQHDHQSLLRVESHLTFLDAFAETTEEFSAYQSQWTIVRDISNKYKDLTERREDIIKNREQILFALREIEDISPIPGELEKLEMELSRIKHSVFITEKQHVLSQIIHEDDSSVQNSIGKIRMILEELCKIDKSYETALQEIQSASASIEEVYEIVKAKKSEEIVDSDSLQERMSKLIWLKKKYGSFEHVFEVWNTLKQQALLSDDIDGEIVALSDRLLNDQRILGLKATELSTKRKSAISRLESLVESNLQIMGIEKPAFKVSHTHESLKSTNSTNAIAITKEGQFSAFSHGIDIVEFMISLNSGEACKPLAKAASGGEISRIMLSLKSLINEKAGVPLMVFDEIDTGISGKVSRKVGAVMKELGSHKQIIAISHSPQISSLANHHILVKKTSETDTTRVQAMHVSDENRVHEIASLISGATITRSAIESAKELLLARDL
jgi:DNA repair protein RecN (Recombination protein N)